MNGLTPTGVLLPKAVQGSDGSLPSPSQLQQRDMLFGKKRVAEDCYLGNTPKASCLSPPGSGPDFVKPAKSFLFEFYQLRDLRPDFQVWSVPSFRCRLVPGSFPQTTFETEGSSKKAAEAKAAELALEALKNRRMHHNTVNPLLPCQATAPIRVPSMIPDSSPESAPQSGSKPATDEPFVPNDDPQDRVQPDIIDRDLMKNPSKLFEDYTEAVHTIKRLRDELAQEKKKRIREQKALANTIHILTESIPAWADEV